MRSEVALLNLAVGLDALGTGLDQFPRDLRDAIVARYPREDFKEGMVQAVFGGVAHKPGTTYGTVWAGIPERFIPWKARWFETCNGEQKVGGRERKMSGGTATALCWQGAVGSLNRRNVRALCSSRERSKRYRRHQPRGPMKAGAPARDTSLTR
jgi:hypothetical protein